MNESNKTDLIKFLMDRLLIEVDPLDKYIYQKTDSTTIYHIPTSIFMKFDLAEIKKHYSHFSWQLDSRWSYYEVTTELRQSKQLP